MKFSGLNLDKLFFYASAALWTWLFFVFIVTGNTYYEVSDNLQIEWLISGVYGKSIYSFPRFFQLYGYPLSFLYQNYSGISWLGVLLILLNYISGLCLLWCLVLRTTRYHFRIRIALILIIVAFLTDFILYLDFTRSALLAGLAGVLIFFCSEKYHLKACGLLLIVAAIGLRFMAIYFIGLISFIWLFYEFKINRLLVAYGAVLLFSYLSFGIPDKVFHDFIELNKSKTVFNDYGVYREDFKEQNCFGEWFFLDQEVNQKVINAASEISVFSRFSMDKFYRGLYEAKGQLQWLILVVGIAFLTRRYSVLGVYILLFIALIIFFKFAVKVWVVISLYLVFIALFTSKNESNHKLYWIGFLLSMGIIVVIKTAKRIDYAKDMHQSKIETINSLYAMQKHKLVFVINPYDFRSFVNPFSLKQQNISNAVFLTGWQTIHPEYRQLITSKLNLQNKPTVKAVADRLRNNYIILNKKNITDFNTCVNSKLNLKLSFVNQQQKTDNATNNRLKLFYVR